MNGVTSITWMKTTAPAGAVAGTVILTRDNNDWIVSADGRSITINGATVTTKGLNWYNASAADRYLSLTTAAGQSVVTPTITATP